MHGYGGELWRRIIEEDMEEDMEEGYGGWLWGMRGYKVDAYGNSGSILWESEDLRTFRS